MGTLAMRQEPGTVFGRCLEAVYHTERGR